jgi:hypothetical protein
MRGPFILFGHTIGLDGSDGHRASAGTRVVVIVAPCALTSASLPCFSILPSA